MSFCDMHYRGSGHILSIFTAPLLGAIILTCLAPIGGQSALVEVPKFARSSGKVKFETFGDCFFTLDYFVRRFRVSHFDISSIVSVRSPFGGDTPSGLCPYISPERAGPS